ncbi:MotA/TolQ/ExbB proton channel family protein [Piscinibacterium candidicorallinum]|uniref:MotA/TolQ/ExbB proton channel family protein n=1 Tax=Piscinibacterium candidicorallinum TaxID=1793872 RepID=A0ABV7H741_9BURK
MNPPWMRGAARAAVIGVGLGHALVAHAQAKPLNVFDQLAAGGSGIWVIGALSVLALAVTIERLVRFRVGRLAPAGLTDAVIKLWQRGELTEAQRLVSQTPSTLASVLGYLLAHRTADPASLSARAGDMASLALREQQQRAYPLAVVATVAPIVGLLGTVIGMIEAFHVIAFSSGLGDPSLLAGGISKALVNTAAGLAVALPSLAMHHYFKYRLQLIGIALEKQVNRVFDEVLIQPRGQDAH